MERKYKVFYPNQYTPEEQVHVDDALKAIGADKVDIPHYEIDVTPEIMKEYARLWNPYDPLYNDPEYGKNTRWGQMPAMTFAPYDMFDTYFDCDDDDIAPLGDVFYFGNDGGDLYFHKPIFAGDHLKVIKNYRKMTDDTIPGDIYRRFTFSGKSSVYNQKGELVTEATGSGRNAVIKFDDDGPVPSNYDQTFEWVNYIPPVHITTDEEWDQIRAMWKAEKIRGAEILYWDDVNIGDQPIPVCSGPISDMDLVRQHGAALIAMPSTREFLEAGEEMMKDAYGQYLNFVARHYSYCRMPGCRAVFYNFTARDFVVRMITNWMGDNGFITHIGWRFQNLYKCMSENKPGAEELNRVPGMEGKYVNRHGMEGDTAICKGYVTKKYEKDGKYYVQMTCWSETFDGDIIQVVDADVELPKR